MSLLVRPLPFTISFAHQKSVYPASNTAIDEPALVYVSNRADPSVVIDLGTSPQDYDTVAIIGHNMGASDTVTIRISDDDSNPWDYAETKDAITGTVPDGSTASMIVRLPSTLSLRYVRFNMATANSDIQIQRIVVGKALEFGSQGGIETAAEQSFYDQSVQYQGDGWTSFDEFGVLPQWNVSATFIDEGVFANQWFSFLSQMGKNKAFLFVPQTFDATRWQSEAIFGRIINQASANVQGHDLRRVELQIRALAP